jgi:photosystem II stability/assembly factor-like uncharacterized protein
MFLSMAHICIAQGEVSTINDSNLIIKEGFPFTGKALFKFVIVSDSTVLWSNDGSCNTFRQPLDAVEVMVTNGVYESELGRHPMNPIFVELLNQYTDLKLVTWVNLGQGFQLQSKVQLRSNMFLEMEIPSPSHSPRRIRSLPANFNRIIDTVGNMIVEKPTDADGWQKQWFAQHKDADGKIPYDGLINAKRHIDKMPQPKDAGLWSWEWLGPGNIGGRIRAIAVNPSNPDIILIGSVGGGLWKSNNGGDSWSVVNDFLPNLAITSIVYDPTNANILYASTGEGFTNVDALPGAGIFKSTNGGSTWSQLNSTNSTDFVYVNRLAHHPDSTDILFAATSSPNAIWKTVDGGLTWDSVLTAPYGFVDVKVSPHSPFNILVACCFGSVNSGQGGAVYVSDDWGNTWEKKSKVGDNMLPSVPYRSEVAFSQSNASRIYIIIGKNGGEIWNSSNGGQTWHERSSGNGFLGMQQWYNQSIWVDPTNDENIVVGGIDLWRSTNGGSSINKISDWRYFHNNSSANSAHCDNHIIISDPGYNGIDNFRVYVGNDGGIQKTENVLTVDDTTGWINLAGTTLGITQFYGGAATSDGSTIIGGAQDNDHLRYKSSGTWSGAANWYQAQTGDGGFAAIDFTNPDIHYSEYTHLKMSKSSDGGDTRNYCNFGLEDAGKKDSSLFIAPFVMDPNNSQRLFAGGLSIWRTTNEATNWTQVRDWIQFGVYCSAIDIAPGNSNIVWVGYDRGDIAYTLNSTLADPNWVRINDSLLPFRYVTDIAINPANSDEVFITFGGYYSDNVWFTSDGGETWENRSGTVPDNLPALQVNSIRFHPRFPNWVYIGTDFGVFASDDKGIHWAIDPRYPAQNNELPANVCVSELFWQGDDHLIAATHGRGMYRAYPHIALYVDKNAAPGGNGSQAAPFQTVTQAVNAATAVCVIYIKSNTYNEPPLQFTKKGRVKSSNGPSRIK